MPFLNISSNGKLQQDNKDARSTPWNDKKFAFIGAENNWISFFHKKWAIGLFILHQNSYYMYALVHTSASFLAVLPSLYLPIIVVPCSYKMPLTDSNTRVLSTKRPNMSEQVAKARSRTPWVGLAAAVWVLFATANDCNFAHFSPAPKLVVGYNQQQIAILGVADDLGSNIGVWAGIALYYSPCQVVSFGSVFCLLGYVLVWLAVMKRAGNLPYSLCQQQFTILGVAADIGENAGILPGTVCNKFNPWFELSVGALSCFCGCVLLCLTVIAAIRNISYWTKLRRQ